MAATQPETQTVESRQAIVTPERDPIVLRVLAGLFTIAVTVVAATLLARC